MPLLFVRSIKRVLIISIQLALLLSLTTNAYSQTFQQFGDSAGLPYPANSNANVTLKEADVKISTQSLWARVAEGFEPHHTVFMNIQGRYTIQNQMNEKVDLPLKIPLPTSLNIESLKFVVNEAGKNYSSVEYDNPLQSGTGLQLFALDMALDPNSTNVLEVSVQNSGIGSIEEDFTFILTNAAKWSKPVGKIDVSLENENSLITGYSIPPTTTTLKAATWEFDSAPQKDLAVKWKVLTSPVNTQVSPTDIKPNPFIPPIIAIVIGGLIVGGIAYLRVKRKKNALSKSANCLSLLTYHSLQNSIRQGSASLHSAGL